MKRTEYYRWIHAHGIICVISAACVIIFAEGGYKFMVFIILVLALNTPEMD